MSTPYTEFLPHVLPLAPNCPEVVAVNAIRNTVIDFCKQTLVLQQDVDPITLQANTAEYDLDVEAGYTSCFVIGLYYNGFELLRASQLSINQHGSQNWQALQGKPRFFTQFRPETITVAPKPTETEVAAITGRVAIAPNRTSSGVDNLLFNEYLDPIVNGTLSRLMAQPNQPYSDVAGAIAFGSLYRIAAAKVRVQSNSGLSAAPLRAKARNF